MFINLGKKIDGLLFCLDHHMKLVNYKRVQSTRLVVQILLIKLKEGLILSSPTSTRITDLEVKPTYSTRNLITKLVV